MVVDTLIFPVCKATYLWWPEAPEHRHQGYCSSRCKERDRGHPYAWWFRACGFKVPINVRARRFKSGAF